jgi:hypothetical protein
LCDFQREEIVLGSVDGLSTRMPRSASASRGSPAVAEAHKVFDFGECFHRLEKLAYAPDNFERATPRGERETCRPVFPKPTAMWLRSATLPGPPCCSPVPLNAKERDLVISMVLRLVGMEAPAPAKCQGKKPRSGDWGPRQRHRRRREPRSAVLETRNGNASAQRVVGGHAGHRNACALYRR